VAPAAAAGPAIKARPARILIVDDDGAVSDFVGQALERDGHATATAPNGAVALELLHQKTFDLIISDTRMPVVDGQSFYAELLRAFPSLRQRVIFLTGDVLSQEKLEFLAKTGAPFLAKPCDVEDLRRTVNRVLAAVGDAARGAGAASQVGV
jgi:two-component system response regulator MprA